MSTIRKALEGITLPPGAEEAITAAEKTQRDDAAYIQHLESKLSTLDKSPNERNERPSVHRREWEKSRGQSVGVQDIRIDAVKEKILVFMSTYQRVVVVQVAEHIGIGFAAAMHYLESLQTDSFVLVAYNAMGEHHWQWSLSPQGRTYLFDHGLLT